MADDSDLGLDDRLRSLLSPMQTANQAELKNYIDSKINDLVRPGGLNYTNITTENREFTATISTDGIGGSYRNIQDALNYVRTKGGGRILVLPGTYTISTSLTIYADTSIEGLSTSDCIIDFNNTTNNFIFDTNATYIQIRSLTIKNSTSSLGSINTNSADRCGIYNCLFSNNTIDIYINGSGQIDINKNTTGALTASGTFVKTGVVSSLNWIENNLVNNCTSWSFEDCSQTNLINNYIQSPGTHIFHGNFSFSTINNNFVVNGGSVAALDLVSCGDTLVTNNVFNTHLILGTVSNSTFSSNKLRSDVTGIHGISLIKCTDNTITGNAIATGTASTIDGIRLSGTTGGCVVSGNAIRISSGTPSYAVNIVDTSCAFNAVVGNFAFGNLINNGGTNGVVASNS